jgi:hypothetical protein
MADDTNLANPFIQGMLSGQEFKMNQFALQEAPLKLEKEKLALKVAETDYAKQEAMAKLLTQHSKMIPEGQNPMTNAADMLVEMGNDAAAVGLPEEAAKNFTSASKIMATQETVAYRQWQEAVNKEKFATQILAGVTDEKSWVQANAYVKMMSPDQKNPLEGKPYSPELVEALRKSAATKRTEAQEAYSRAQAAAEKVKAQLDTEKIELTKTQETLNLARADQARKVGGDGLIAKPKNIAAVTDLIVKDSGDSMSTADARTFARDIALRGEEIMDKEHLTQAQAMTKAVEEAKRHGALAGISPAHVKAGASQKKPLPIPKDVKELKPNMWYQGPEGPMWYDAETQSLYNPGEGPGDEEEEEEK